MSRIAFMAGKIDRALDVDRQVGVHLDDAAIISLVPVVAAPALLRHVLDGEALARWKLDVLQRAAPAPIDGGLEHAVQPIGRDDELFAELLVALDEGGLRPLRTGSARQ